MSPAVSAHVLVVRRSVLIAASQLSTCSVSLFCVLRVLLPKQMSSSFNPEAAYTWTKEDGCILKKPRLLAKTGRLPERL